MIADSYVDKEFGTGVVKITPAHDPNDFEVGLRRDLQQIRVMDDRAVMNENAGKYAGMERYEARKRIVEDLRELGLLEKIENHSHNVGTCYRCDTVIEPILSRQWFVKMKPLAEPAIRSSQERYHKVCARKVFKDILQLDGKHPGLVHIETALMGTPHTCILLPGMRRDDSRARAA